MEPVTGLVLAAGAGRRANGPKALRRSADGTPWLALGADLLLDAGCSRVVVVLGAMAEFALPLIPDDPRVGTVIAADWDTGVSASLRAGIRAATGTATLVTLVDLPDLPASVARRVLGDGVAADDLRQAVFGGRPGHPVLLGSAHWDAIAHSVHGDQGAREYLVAHEVREVECGDLASGDDVDAPA